MLHDLGFKYKYVVLLVWNIGVFSCPNKYVDMYISCDIFFLLIALFFLYQVVMWIFIFNFFHLFNIKDMLKMVQMNAFSISFQMELFAKVFILKKPFSVDVSKVRVYELFLDYIMKFLKCFCWEYLRIHFLECPAGYFGNNCSKLCIPPAYGCSCTQRCDCPICHYIVGCIFTPKSTITDPGNNWTDNYHWSITTQLYYHK